MTHRKYRYYIKKIQAAFVDQNENVIIFMCSVWNYARPYRSVFLNRRAVARYRALASIIPGRERFSWNLSF